MSRIYVIYIYYYMCALPQVIKGTFGNECPIGNEVSKLYITAGGSAELRCGILPAGGTLIWRSYQSHPYGDIVIGHHTTDDPVYVDDTFNPPSRFVYSETTHSLTVTGFTEDDAHCFECSIGAEGSFYYLNLKVVPNTVTLQNSDVTFSENTDVAVTYKLLNAKPGKSHSVFTVSVGDDYSISSSSSDLADVSAQDNGAVDVRYRGTVNLQRQHNGLVMVSEVTWMSDTMIQSTGKTVDVTFSATSVSMSSQPAVGELVLEGNTITVQCITDEGNPTPTITWTRDGSSLVSSSTENIENTDENGSCCNAKRRKSLLTIRVFRTFHNKQYMCSGPGTSSEMFTLLVKFAHTVSIDGLPQGGEITEQSNVTLTCEATGGNPAVESYEWKVRYRYNNTERVITSGTTAKTLRLTSVDYTSAGTYTCTATNAGGDGQDSSSLLVRYTPIDTSSSSQKRTETAINTFTQMKCTVQAYPVVQIHHVNIYNGYTRITSGFTITEKTDETDVSVINLDLANIQRSDFGIYTVVVDNGAGRINITLVLEENGPPDPLYSIQAVNISTNTATVTWRSGHSGGSTQTFQLYHKSATEVSYTVSEIISDPGVDKPVNYRLTGLLESTVYTFKVVSTNQYKGYNQAESSLIAFTTLAAPILGPEFKALHAYNYIIFIWDVIVGEFTKIAIEQCDKNTPKTCTEFVQMRTATHTTLYDNNTGSEYDYNLLVYQHSDVATRRQFFVQANTLMTNESESNTSLIFGVIVGILIVVIISMLILFIYLRIRHKTAESKSSTSGPAYANENFHNISSTSRDDAINLPVVYEPVQEMTPKLPPVYTTLAGTLQVINNAQDSSVGQISTYENTGVAVKDHMNYEETELNQDMNVFASTPRTQDNAIYEPIQ